MAQSKFNSALESLTNVSVGLVISIIVQVHIFPLFGIHLNYSQSAGIAITFTCISIVRSYAIRRLFNRVNEQS